MGRNHCSQRYDKHRKRCCKIDKYINLECLDICDKRELRKALGKALFKTCECVSCLKPKRVDEVKGFKHLKCPAFIIRDERGIPHIIAENDHDLWFLAGYTQASDSFFVMDQYRRFGRGTLAELFGPSGLGDDDLVARYNIHRDYDAQVDMLSTPQAKELVTQFSRGVNAWLDNNPLSPEYEKLYLTKASVKPWTPGDCLACNGGASFGISFFDSFGDFDTFNILDALFGGLDFLNASRFVFEDTLAIKPTEDIVIAPGFLDEMPVGPCEIEDCKPCKPKPCCEKSVKSVSVKPQSKEVGKQTKELVEINEEDKAKLDKLRARLNKISETVKKHPIYGGDKGETMGSQIFQVSGEHTDTGKPYMFYDPHIRSVVLGRMEQHLIVIDDPCHGPANFYSSHSVAGEPVPTAGHTKDATFGVTINAIDLWDVFVERVFFVDGVPVETEYVRPEGNRHIRIVEDNFKINIGVVTEQFDDIVDDSRTLYFKEFPEVPDGQGDIWLAGLDLGDPEDWPENGDIIGYSFLGAISRVSEDLEAVAPLFLRLKNVCDVETVARARDSTIESNIGTVDTCGNIAYFTNWTAPLREDLQEDEAPETGFFPNEPIGPFGIPVIGPWGLRDGTGTFKHEWLVDPGFPGNGSKLPFQCLPFDEMPQSINPDSGYIINANQDPAGALLTFTVEGGTNQVRPGGGQWYLNKFVSFGERAERMRLLLDDRLSQGCPVTEQFMNEVQANNQPIIVERSLPFWIEAFENGTVSACPELKALTEDPRVAEAIERFKNWDLTTPTGIKTGYDACDDPKCLPDPTPCEVANSIATTIFTVAYVRAQRNWVRPILSSLFISSSSLYFTTLEQLLIYWDNIPGPGQPGNGFGSSGVNFFPDTLFGGNWLPCPTQEERRDYALLEGLQNALDRLDSNTNFPAFRGSTDQNDYQWGKIHTTNIRNFLDVYNDITEFNIPPIGDYVITPPPYPYILTVEPPVLTPIDAYLAQYSPIVGTVSNPAIFDPGNANGCAPFAPNSLDDHFGLVERGSCSFVSKTNNVENAGGLGTIIINSSNDPLVPAGSLAGSFGTWGIKEDDGKALKIAITDYPELILTFTSVNNSELSRIARPGWRNTVDVAPFSSGANNNYEFNFSPAARYFYRVGKNGITSKSAHRAGQSTDPSSPFYAQQTERWLVNKYYEDLTDCYDALKDSTSTSALLPCRYLKKKHRCCHRH